MYFSQLRDVSEVENRKIRMVFLNFMTINDDPERARCERHSKTHARCLARTIASQGRNHLIQLDIQLSVNNGNYTILPYTY